ncbi:hypothetical protein [Hymenobacter arizonensis]|uniref:Uncharacterized protein n=1 Tax=Hymenobacter arizonensis TaxID=1227077 RepID=A0A1I5VBA8_HYMAR|nr:hypothetical protein [Hymenobacter arizonensis]SFQ04818.1 hypothetical protein SAMN04515668_1269 [Hymenobacter arizonensis]
MPTKESRELYLLERFLPELFSDTYILSQPAPPLPDAIVQVSGKKIGIEMTALILDEQSREREAKQDAILNEAQKLFEKQLHLPLHVTVDFSESGNWKNLERKQVAGLLADVVKRCVLAVKDLPESQTEFTIRTEAFVHPCIHSVSIFFLSRLTVPCWTPITTFWVPDAPLEKIQEIINRKSKNVNGYLTGCDEVWLLMLETGSPSSYYDHFEKLQEVAFDSGFARTLIGRISKGELVTLQTKRAL